MFLKLENQQLTGSFKIRGAMNKLLSLTKKQRDAGIVTASTGNHARAVAHGLKLLRANGTICLPKTVAKTKADALRDYDVTLKFHGTDAEQTEVFARQVASDRNQVYISPYNDLQVVTGQGTIGLELTKQLDKIDYVLVPVGGGGMITGIAGYLKAAKRDIKIIGCLPKNSPVMYKSIKAGRIVNMITKPTISDATAGGIESNTITFDFCRKYVDDYILVTESQIERAIGLALDKHRLIIEGAAGVAVAAFLSQRMDFNNKNVVLVLSGGNIGIETLKGIIC